MKKFVAEEIEKFLRLFNVNVMLKVSNGLSCLWNF